MGVGWPLGRRLGRRRGTLPGVSIGLTAQAAADLEAGGRLFGLSADLVVLLFEESQLRGGA